MRSLAIILGGLKHRMKAHYPETWALNAHPNVFKGQKIQWIEAEPDSLGFKDRLSHLLIQNLRGKKKGSDLEQPS